jgi:hypothetical protein
MVEYLAFLMLNSYWKWTQKNSLYVYTYKEQNVDILNDNKEKVFAMLYL